ncbi:cation:proton antiporter [Salinibacter ruber]|nr:cation:proton antiporter [Salinibacter ruber]MCS4054872.1 Kef-type K+ transport system membrane component KefB [Salinibacter ruber]MCS4058127.1 Kef-type K+ transport system membrane component KefB [Salinibacter ruber]MCS4160217.1 Kef-type K+ transport system membrane component KefB [Salinibacter ruber]
MEDLAARGALLVGILIVLSRLAKAALERLNLPDLLGYLFIGMALRLVEGTSLLRFVDGPQVLSFLAQLGIVALLFRIGLECTPKNLLRRLSGATRIWIANITLSLGAVLGVALFLLDWALLPSLFAAVALTATGIGVSVRIWRHTDRLGSAKGALMLDVAELDDLSGVVLLALLTALVPQLQAGLSADLVGPMALLALGGLLFAQYLEHPLTHWLHDIQPRPDLMISVLGIGLVGAGLAALLGFSAAIGAFFAGLIFSRDPLSVKIDASFDSLSDLFIPFFFLHVGFALDLSLLFGNLGAVLLLFAAAVVGKGLGSFMPVMNRLRPSSALTFAVALIPRSEITLLVMQRGLDLGVVSPDAFAVVVAVVILTMGTVPLALRLLLPPVTTT